MSNQKINIDEKTKYEDIPNIENDETLTVNFIKINKKYFQEYYKKEYMKKFKFNMMSNIKNKKVDLFNSSMQRSDALRLIKEKYQYNTMDTIVIVMKLYDYKTRQETNYGTLFCELIDNVNPERQKSNKFSGQLSGNVVFTFFSASPSYISQDGEYRSHFISYMEVKKSKKYFIDVWDDIDEYVNKIRRNRGWSLFTSYFYPKMEQESRNNDVEYNVKSEFIDITLLCIAWFNTIFDEMVGLKKNHVNEKYINIFLKDSEEDILFLKDLIKKYTKKRIEDFKKSFSYYSKITSYYDQVYINCGYKMMPLNIKEVQDPLKLKYKPWREFFISNRCNDLIINNISPNFAFMLDWFYIKNSRKGLFDNISQYDKMKNSEIAKGILQILYEAQRNTYFISENINSVNKTQNNIKEWFNTKFKKLNEKIDDSINYSMEEIIMSEVTLGFVNEYVGRTIADSINMTQKSKKYDQMLCHPFKDSGFNYFAKYMFEICYGLLCINEKFNIIHGDLHLNNATIGQLYYLNELNILDNGDLRKRGEMKNEENEENGDSKQNRGNELLGKAQKELLEKAQKTKDDELLGKAQKNGDDETGDNGDSKQNRGDELLGKAQKNGDEETGDNGDSKQNRGDHSGNHSSKHSRNHNNDFNFHRNKLLSKKNPHIISDTKIKKKINVLYALDDNYQYVFPNNGFFSCIIDFSRSIINPINYLNFTDKSLPISYKLVDNEDKFVANEISNLLKLYLQMYPNKIKQQEELVVLFKKYFDAVFKTLTAIDIYMISLRILRTLQQLPPQNISKKSIQLIEKINNCSEVFITTEMNNLIHEPEEYSKKILAEEYPLMKIIKKCFAEFNNLDLPGEISDMYCYNNEIKYSMDTYELMPEYMTSIKAEINNKLVELKYYTNTKKKLLKEFEKQKTQNLDMVNYIATRHKQKLF